MRAGLRSKPSRDTKSRSNRTPFRGRIHRSRGCLGRPDPTQAQKENREIKVAKFPWAASGRAVTLDRPEGMTKLIIDPLTERVLGVGIVGAGAPER